MTTGFLKNIREITQRYVQEVEQESQQFAAAIHAIRGIPAPAPATVSIEQRLSQLEQNYQRQLQKTVAGLSEDIGDLDSRLAAIEREQREEEPWASWPAGESLAESLHNVVVIDPPVVDNSGSRNIVVHMNDDDDVDMGSSALETKTVEIKQVQGKPTVVAEVKPTVVIAEVKPTAVAEIKPTEVAVKQMEDAEEDAEEAEEEEEEGLELEEFTFNGDSYYKDTDNNVYTANEEGEVEETPIGRWLEKRQTIKFYTATPA